MPPKHDQKPWSCKTSKQSKGTSNAASEPPMKKRKKGPIFIDDSDSENDSSDSDVSVSELRSRVLAAMLKRYVIEGKQETEDESDTSDDTNEANAEVKEEEDGVDGLDKSKNDQKRKQSKLFFVMGKALRSIMEAKEKQGQKEKNQNGISVPVPFCHIKQERYTKKQQHDNVCPTEGMEYSVDKQAHMLQVKAENWQAELDQVEEQMQNEQKSSRPKQLDSTSVGKDLQQQYWYQGQSQPTQHEEPSADFSKLAVIEEIEKTLEQHQIDSFLHDCFVQSQTSQEQKLSEANLITDTEHQECLTHVSDHSNTNKTVDEVDHGKKQNYETTEEECANLKIKPLQKEVTDKELLKQNVEFVVQSNNSNYKDQIEESESMSHSTDNTSKIPVIIGHRNLHQCNKGFKWILPKPQVYQNEISRNLLLSKHYRYKPQRENIEEKFFRLLKTRSDYRQQSDLVIGQQPQTNENMFQPSEIKTKSSNLMHQNIDRTAKCANQESSGLAKENYSFKHKNVTNSCEYQNKSRIGRRPKESQTILNCDYQNKGVQGRKLKDSPQNSMDYQNKVVAERKLKESPTVLSFDYQNRDVQGSKLIDSPQNSMDYQDKDVAVRKPKESQNDLRCDYQNKGMLGRNLEESSNNSSCDYQNKDVAEKTSNESFRDPTCDHHNKHILGRQSKDSPNNLSCGYQNKGISGIKPNTSQNNSGEVSDVYICVNTNSKEQFQDGKHRQLSSEIKTTNTPLSTLNDGLTTGNNSFPENLPVNRHRATMHKESLVMYQKRTLIALNFPKTMREKELKQLSPDILSVKIPPFYASQTAAYFVFANERVAEKNFKLLSGRNIEFNGQKLCLNYIGSKSLNVPHCDLSSCDIYEIDPFMLRVVDDDKNVYDSRLRRLFPAATKIVIRTRAGSRQSQAYIYFDNERDCQAAYERSQGKHPLLVQYGMVNHTRINSDKTRKRNSEPNASKYKEQQTPPQEKGCFDTHLIDSNTLPKMTSDLRQEIEHQPQKGKSVVKKRTEISQKARHQDQMVRSKHPKSVHENQLRVHLDQEASLRVPEKVPKLQEEILHTHNAETASQRDDSPLLKQFWRSVLMQKHRAAQQQQEKAEKNLESGSLIPRDSCYEVHKSGAVLPTFNNKKTNESALKDKKTSDGVKETKNGNAQEIKGLKRASKKNNSEPASKKEVKRKNPAKKVQQEEAELLDQKSYTGQTHLDPLTVTMQAKQKSTKKLDLCKIYIGDFKTSVTKGKAVKKVRELFPDADNIYAHREKGRSRIFCHALFGDENQCQTALNNCKPKYPLVVKPWTKFKKDRKADETAKKEHEKIREEGHLMFKTQGPVVQS